VRLYGESDGNRSHRDMTPSEFFVFQHIIQNFGGIHLDQRAIPQHIFDGIIMGRGAPACDQEKHSSQRFDLPTYAVANDSEGEYPDRNLGQLCGIMQTATWWSNALRSLAYLIEMPSTLLGSAHREATQLQPCRD